MADIQRRDVIATGGLLAAAGVVAACSSGGTGMTGEPAESPLATPDAGQASPSGALAAIADVPVGGGVVVPDAKVVIVQPTEGAILGYTAVCPHQGCLVSEVVDNTIVCACHQSIFSSEDGAVISGPATTGLASADVQIDGNYVVLG
jgi:nitrite reductase/ring-hydroxylating ferredoxin subunit